MFDLLRKITTYVVLSCMLLHGANQVNLLSYLYQQRHDVAAAFGYIMDAPIALCGSSYEPSDDIQIHISAPTDDETVPPLRIFSSKIIYYPGFAGLTLETQSSGTGIVWFRPGYQMLTYKAPATNIFTPPRG